MIATKYGYLMMKLEYLDDITDGGRYPYADPDKLIRLYDFDCTEARQLQEAIRLQVISHNHPLMLSSLPFITAVNCQLTLIPASTNEGISVTSDNNDFKGLFTMAYFEEMLAIMEPFTNERDYYGYNWLMTLKKGRLICCYHQVVAGNKVIVQHIPLQLRQLR